MKSIRILAACLIFSLSLNLVLLVSFAIADTAPEAPLQVVSRSTQKGVATNARVFEAMTHLSFRELVSFLTNKEPVEEGFAKRDLAVSALVAFHHFNLEKAIAGAPTQVRVVSFSPTQSIDLFPGLSDDQFEAIVRYAYQEKWPLTAKGLFTLLQKDSALTDETLLQAFLVTNEFRSIQTLFQKTGVNESPETILKLISEGNWETLDQFSREQAQMLDFSPEKRRALLLSYFSNRSKTAASLLLRTDYAFVLKRFEDKGMLDLLSLISEPSEESIRFCTEILRSPRTDAVLLKAAGLLYAFSGKTTPEPVDLKTALAQFVPTAAPVEKSKPAAASHGKSHVVKEGETLWKISKQYKVKVDELAKLNDLEKKSLRPGMTLKIPQ